MKRVLTFSIVLLVLISFITGCKDETKVDWDSYDESTSAISLFDCGLGDEDIVPVQDLTGLVSLSLMHNRISDLSPLANLTNLTELYLSGNKISDLTPLMNLTNLTSLFLNDNRISDLSPLANLTNLTYLRLQNNNIDNWSYVAHVSNVEGNPAGAIMIGDAATGLKPGQLFCLSFDETQSIPMRWEAIVSDESLIRLICTDVDGSGLAPNAPPGSSGEKRIFYFEALAPGECSIDMYSLMINRDDDINELEPTSSYTFVINE